MRATDARRSRRRRRRARRARMPVSAVKNPGSSSVRYPTTGTPSVSSRSHVAGRSRIDFAPAQTTIIGVRASSARSADSSNGASRCTPPIPPVANTSIPALARQRERRGDRRRAVEPAAPSRPARSRAETLRTPSRARNRSSSSGSSPTVGVPCTTAVIAGDGARALDRADHSLGGVAVLRNRQSLREHGALERDDGRAVVERACDVGKDADDRGTSVRCQVRASCEARARLRGV